MGMRPGKLKASVMERSVLRQLHKGLKKSDGQIERSFTGREAGLMSIHTVEGPVLAARRAVWGAAGKLLAAGGIPDRIDLSLLLPEDAEERFLKDLIREIADECASCMVEPASSTVAVSSRVRDLVITMACMGHDAGGTGYKDRKMASSAGDSEGASLQRRQPSDSLDLVVAGPVALEGTALIALEQREKLLSRYPAFFVDEAAAAYSPEVYEYFRGWRSGGTTDRPDYDRWEDPFLQCFYLGEGGVFAGLWEYAAAAGVGLEVELSRIPIKQHTIEVCEFFGRNPYQLFSGGSLLLACQNGGRLVHNLEDHGLEAAVIGHTHQGNDRIIRYGDGEIRYLEPPKEDEYYLINPHL